MRTNGLVVCAAGALLCSLANASLAFDDGQVLSLHEISGTFAAEQSASDLTAAVLTTDAVTADGDYDCACDDGFCGRCPHWFAGVEFTAVNISAPTDGIVNLSFDDSGTGGAEIRIRDGNGMDGVVGYAPRVWVGRQIGEKWGVAARFWTLHHTLSGFPSLVPGTTPLPTFGTYINNDKLEMYNVSVDVIRSFRHERWKFDAIGGVCNASINAESEVFAFGVITTGNFANVTLQNGFGFDGTGLTGGFTGRRQIGDGPFSFFGAARTSHLWGVSDSFGRSAGTVASFPSAPLVGAATVTRTVTDATMDVTEIQLGGQVDFELTRVPVTAFVRAAYEFQYWDVDSRPTGGAGFGGTIGTLTTNSFSSAGIGHATLNGFAFSVGFNW